MELGKVSFGNFVTVGEWVNSYVKMKNLDCGFCGNYLLHYTYHCNHAKDESHSFGN